MVGLPADCVHAAFDVETQAGVAAAVARVREILGDGAVLALDEYSPVLFATRERHGLRVAADASEIIGAAKLCKTPVEIECIHRAQQINERAMRPLQAALRPGLRQSDLTALFFGRIYELGATANGIDPIWQVMPPRLADGPWTTHGGVAFPTCTTDRILREGDVLWVDTGIDYHGYQSDFGRTFVVGARPTPRQLDQGRRWRDVVSAVLERVKPGVTGGDLTRCATEVAGGARPWPAHLYLVHGVGTEAAEPPLIGTDLGPAFDETVVLQPGMVLVLEPAIWDDGHAGYRSEEIVAVTDDGYEKLSAYTYEPYAHCDEAMGT